MDNSHVFALVTGASRGIGKSITEKLLGNGAEVIGTARNSEFPESFTASDRFNGLHVDLSKQNAIEEIVKPIFELEKIPNVLINNAGIFEDCSFEEEDDRWLSNLKRTMQVNLNAAAILSKWALNRWSREEGGILINIASRAAYRGDTEEYASYAASKGALVAFTKSIARDFGTKGISAYSIAPGFIKTDMAMDSIRIYGEEYLTEGMAFDEITSPDEVGELVSFLASGKVRHMTGSTFHINGGSYMI